MNSTCSSLDDYYFSMIRAHRTVLTRLRRSSYIRKMASTTSTATGNAACALLLRRPANMTEAGGSAASRSSSGSSTGQPELAAGRLAIGTRRPWIYQCGAATADRRRNPGHRTEEQES